MVGVPGVRFVLAPQPSRIKVEVALWSERMAQPGLTGPGHLQMQTWLLGVSAGRPDCVVKLEECLTHPAPGEMEELVHMSISIEPLSGTRVAVTLAPPLRPMPTYK